MYLAYFKALQAGLNGESGAERLSITHKDGEEVLIVAAGLPDCWIAG